ncbi:MAG: hypothetical protein L6U16_02830 [Porphyromonadaceae bacterium]|nr:MAG: hypothetical protein L6U16_02830 [Porphyromonadaceae bacterium]
MKITGGKFEEVTSSGTLSIAGSTAGVVYPIKKTTLNTLSIKCAAMATTFTTRRIKPTM